MIDLFYVINSLRVTSTVVAVSFRSLLAMLFLLTGVSSVVFMPWNEWDVAIVELWF